MTVAPGYRPTYIADFNGDGKDDILWENGTSSRWFFFMNGSAIAGSAPVPAAAPGWEIAAVGNFDGLNGADLLWRNIASPSSYWIHLLSNAAAVIGGGNVLVGPGYIPHMDRRSESRRQGGHRVGERGTVALGVHHERRRGHERRCAADRRAGMVARRHRRLRQFAGSRPAVAERGRVSTQYWIHLLSMTGAVIGGGDIWTASGYVPLRRRAWTAAAGLDGAYLVLEEAHAGHERHRHQLPFRQ